MSSPVVHYIRWYGVGPKAWNLPLRLTISLMLSDVLIFVILSIVWLADIADEIF